ncbi:MAG: hypothetical protein AAB874_00680 [Patescibacteria group bacterium]
MVNVPQLVTSIISSFFTGLALYLPQFIAGLLLLLVGMLVSGIVKQVVSGFFNFLKLDKIAKDANVPTGFDLKVWPELFGELLRWTVMILFLVAAVETWGIRKVGDVLNQLLLYLPNVFIAVVMGLVGVVIGNLVSEVVRHGAKGLGTHSAGVLATMARYSIYVFTTLLVLHQLDVAADLIRILFTGVVAMLALAGGLAFGLGGQDTARDVLHGLRNRLENK